MSTEGLAHRSNHYCQEANERLDEGLPAHARHPLLVSHLYTIGHAICERLDALLEQLEGRAD